MREGKFFVEETGYTELKMVPVLQNTNTKAKTNKIKDRPSPSWYLFCKSVQNSHSKEKRTLGAAAA